MTNFDDKSMQFENLNQELEQLQRGDLVLNHHPYDLAVVLQSLNEKSLVETFNRLPTKNKSDVLSHLEVDIQKKMIDSISLDEAVAAIHGMAPDDRVDLIQGLDQEAKKRLMNGLNPETRENIARLELYNPGTAGGVMSTDVLTLLDDLTVEGAMKYLRSVADRQETIYYNYVTNPQGKLVGIVSLRSLILAEPQTKLRDLMNPNVLSARVDDKQEEVARMIRKYDLVALPILHGDDRLAGVVTVDDALDVNDQEATEDFHRMASMGHLTTGIREAGIGLLYRKRIPWLMVLLLINIPAGGVLMHYEKTFESYAALIFFLTLLIDSGGNAGAQSATLTIRSLALGDVRLGDWFSLLVKEIGVSFLLGLTMALGVMMISSVRAPEVMMVVTLTMICTVFMGSLIGMLLPLVLTRLKLDPATASAPLITSIADIVGVVIYFTIASHLLSIQ